MQHGDLQEHQDCANHHQSWLDWSLSSVSLSSGFRERQKQKRSTGGALTFLIQYLRTIRGGTLIMVAVLPAVALMAKLKIAVAVVFQDRLSLAARLWAAMVPERLHVGKAQHKSQVSAFQKGSGKRHRP